MNQNESKHKPSSDHLYLEKLTFNPALRKSWLNFFVTNFRVVILLIILLTAAGIYSFSALPLESNPEVKIPIAVIVTSYPGASPADIEELVTKKIETGVSGIKDIQKISSSSSNSISTVTVEFDAKADLDDSLRKLRDEANNLKTKLPEDANDPFVQEISVSDEPIFTASLTGPYSGLELRDIAEEMKDELEKISGVREVRISGGDQNEFSVAYDPQKINSFNLSADKINQAIRSSNLSIPSGTYEGDEFNYSVRTDSRFFDAKSLGNLPVSHNENGSIVYLKDVADVQEKAIEKTVYSRFSMDGSKPQEDITIQIVKKTGGSIVDTANAAKEKMDEMIQQMPAGLHYDTTIDMAELIRKDFERLTHDFLLTIILVFTILFLIVGLKEALVAGLAVPLVFFATFAVMLNIGISLNFLSMFSLILALGLLVDDAIVVVSATKQYLKTGKFTPEEAVLLVLNDFKVVLLTTTLTTVWAFLPLLSSSGIMGEYIKSIPITVSVTLISSLIIALIINHPLAAVLERIRLTRLMFGIMIGVMLILGWGLVYVGGIFGYLFAGIFLASSLLSLNWYFKNGKAELIANKELTKKEWKDDELIKKKLRDQGSTHDSFLSRLMHGIINFNRVLPTYEKFLRKGISTRKRRIASLSFVFVLFLAALAMPIMGIVKSEFFPVADSEFMWVNIEAPVGLELDETEKIVSQVEQTLMKYPQISNFSTLIGMGGQGQSMTGSFSNPSHISSITIKLVDVDDRDLKAYELAEVIRTDVADIQGANISVNVPSGGPPTGAAFQAQIFGEDLQTLDKIADDLTPHLASIPGVINVQKSLKESPADYTFRLDPVKMELYNLNSAYVGSYLRMAISGLEVTKIIKDGKEENVIVSFAKEKLPSLESVRNIQIKNFLGNPVFLKDVAAIELQPSVDTIQRIDQQRTVLLTSGVSGTTSATQSVKEFQDKIIDYQFPDGYEISYGGENEANNESVMSILRAMVISFLLIISTLVIQFNSFRKAFIILITIPLALIGVFFGLAAAGLSLTFPGLIGILALFGIVVKNAIILVDKIDLNIKTGIGFEESIIDAGKSRLEAIFITSICTIFGIIPITFSNEMWTALGGAIIFGLMLSSFLTLFVVPILYRSLVKND